MVLPYYLVASIENIKDLQPDNFATHATIFEEFTRAAGATWVTDEAGTQGALGAADQRLDHEISFLLLTKTHPDYRHHISELSGTRERWHALRQAFISLTFSDRLVTFDQLISIVHDTSQPVSQYSAQIDKLCKRLEGMGMAISDNVKTAILLVRLDALMLPTKKELAKLATPPTFASAAAQLRSDAHDAIKLEEPNFMAAIKSERSEPVIPGAFAVQVPSPPSTQAPVEAHANGYNWCSPRSDKDCFRCGREGHRAQFCLSDMPQAVRDWVLRSIAQYRPKLYGPRSERAAAATGVDVDADEDEDEILRDVLEGAMQEYYRRMDSTQAAVRSSAARVVI
ncbi:CCHC-type domain-containing protein [Mycena indigotica]|uniref:CCHC-type domain-containing protein n=1 Tax=Mycena indigotica TaxID=2126181 RepID=A0A8H6S3R0_9AGAR|nr:CCHC-type domain-containing protein [Mycena indigotica]KAF7291862.1 CCHC-type domain-containing protein [Mycena indigotica]